ncbi:hypothetical protein [Methanococcus maripaludis]|uniref:Uncharacterized protein n=1 Tax=Methanococcus maripaludis TaxID=39152 RepID=A0A8T4CKT9_METMI|nr:hypothetical protein [Methanococcus maripaludis]MBM7408785.1 hypothetical protein [Methanococcus maripaludis]MBP2219046.1 hypothetical protein [Methanococcus maripaludis]
MFGKKTNTPVSTYDPKLIEKIKPFIVVPDSMVTPERKKEILEVMDEAIGTCSQDGELDYHRLLNIVIQDFGKGNIDEYEFMFLNFVISAFVFHVQTTGIPLDLKKLL